VRDLKVKKAFFVFLVILLVSAFILSGCSGPQTALDNSNSVTDNDSKDIKSNDQSEISQAEHNEDNTSLNETKPGGNETGYTVIDSTGQKIVFEIPPQKIVSLMPSNTEILFELGLGDSIIAVSQYCNYPEKAMEKQKLPTGEQFNTETLISLEPDVLIVGRMSVMDEQLELLKKAGIKVVITEANTIPETYEVISLIGKVTAREEDAENLIAIMKEGFEKIRSQAEGKTPVSVYVEISPLQYGLWTAGKNTFFQELIGIMGATNIFEDMEGWAEVSEEQVIKRNPDVILTTSSPLTGIEDPVGEIISRKNWANINAVKNGKVIMLDGDKLTRPGPRLIEAANELMEALYGN
jgi:iron complex transport system substrate-binding protein